ncbi:uncharacterized protein LOC111452144 isoform X1 [Cucurbita moschata]|uniref:Uncharacterized protein LOC111452144 isoform X1 n=2 Tax=Cucurbita moschata TaxID=3662 RepID=A0A6J1G9A7_CUCMO|nr:uncharacterized protein LOC111452144 isoform X1 [Cucurbita moschata]XP_022948472.1 uncharacterized protein LOC111452144 isoform X1 [Cucurbita moschata]XP_022948473.1 uncharacterized protein LOC111452144 isoform X1 [Cucurbita moschata]XP_022948474.1 uncharacterized protein LOC111452144 isoform X1 [Cucurbita moschata]XP_022948475.1 uncharacterized protein LOC111452144 isoform X1 [Cucurbita moschata]XP_022948476.1 uncharacterized protein LOC111452144 isoform X1 [Cucurbita moschata]
MSDLVAQTGLCLCDDPHFGYCSNLGNVVELGFADSFLEQSTVAIMATTAGLLEKHDGSFPYRFQLEQDVRRLQQKLQEEMELHTSLEDAIQKKDLTLANFSCLPHHAQDLLSSIAVLEDAVVRLEQETVSLHFQLSQEKNERRLAEYRLMHSSPCSISDWSNLDTMKKPNSWEEIEDGLVTRCEKTSVTEVNERSQSIECEKMSRGPPSSGLWHHPNILSEEMVRCMKNIFISLADSPVPSKSSTSESHSPASPQGHLSSSSWWSSSERSIISSRVQSPQIDLPSSSEVLATQNTSDPYSVRGKLSWSDIGNYSQAAEVSWMSVGKKQLEYAAGELRKFRTLVEQLANVNPVHLNRDERLAFWINLYNALIMHAYLAYGVPKSELKLFSLMQKAAYTVGGHSISATGIEYVILKMKPPVHRPQIALLLALHKSKVTEEQRRFAIDKHEPLLTFALSCGTYSSPAVRIYTANNIRDDLLEAQHDFIRASVGVSSKGRLLVPKLLYCFAKNSVDDTNLAVWISHYLPPRQAAFVQGCISQRRQSLIGSCNCGILPFDSHFRYLFLPEKSSLQ